jgi:type II secretory pathway pseudopilin PulG
MTQFRQRLPTARGDVGESLIELIITIMIMGITLPSVIGAVLLAVDVSSQDRRQVQAQRLLTSWSETVADKNSDSTYGSCPAPDYATGTFAPTGLPPGFTASVETIEYWDGAAFTSSCGSDTGARRVKLRMSVDAALYPAFELGRYVIVRKPCDTC